VERNEQTMSRFEQITRAEYLVKMQWECEIDDAGRPDHRIVQQSPLCTCHTLYGGVEPWPSVSTTRHDGLRPFNISMSGASTRTYMQVFQVPFGHPIIHLGEMCKGIEACLCMVGLIKCSIVRPEKLYHPVLSLRCNKKFMFCLCGTCVHTSSNEKIFHTQDEERALNGMWLMDEVSWSLKSGTEYSKYVLYEYQVTQVPKRTRAEFRRLYKHVSETEGGG